MIPEDLHADFQRQVDERVSSDIMAICLQGGNETDESVLETELVNKYVSFYEDQFLAKTWPPKVGHLGVRAGELINRADNWVCGNCSERNATSFETCRKCSENKPEKYEARPRVYPTGQSTSKPAVLQQQSNVWTCKECGQTNNDTDTECVKCKLNQSVYKRDTWPTDLSIDSATRAKLRIKLFKQTIEEFEVDDPLGNLDISHAEFVATVDRLKQKILDDYTNTL